MNPKLVNLRLALAHRNLNCVDLKGQGKTTLVDERVQIFASIILATPSCSNFIKQIKLSSEKQIVHICTKVLKYS